MVVNSKFSHFSLHYLRLEKRVIGKLAEFSQFLPFKRLTPVFKLLNDIIILVVNTKWCHQYSSTDLCIPSAQFCDCTTTSK